MAITVSTTYPVDGGVISTWAALAASETGDDSSIGAYPDKSVQVVGTFTSITIQGSNDRTNWTTLHDPQGADLVFATAGIKSIAENTRYVRPVGVTITGSAQVLIFGAANGS